MTDDRERRFERLLFSHAESIHHNAHDREEYFFVFLVLLSIYTMKRYLKIRRTKTFRLLFALRSKKCEYYFITTIRTTIKLLLLRRW